MLSFFGSHTTTGAMKRYLFRDAIQMYLAMMTEIGSIPSERTPVQKASCLNAQSTNLPSVFTVLRTVLQ